MDTSTVIDFNEQRIIREINDLCIQLAAATRTSTEVAIRIGELLVEVKGTLPHGQWVPWIKANCRFSDVTAGKYMRAFHAMKPELSSSLPQNEAPTIASTARLAKSQRAPKPSRVGWTSAVEYHLGHLPKGFDCNVISQRSRKRPEVEAEFGRPIPPRVERDSQEARDIAAAVQRCYDKQNPDEAHAHAEATIIELRVQVPEKDKDRFDRLLNETRAVMEKQFQVQVDAAVAIKVAAERERHIRAAEQAEAEAAALLGVRMTIEGLMTQEEFKLIRSCLHPDKHPGAEQARFSRAFHIFNDLEKTVNTCLPAAELRKRGWMPANPFSRKPS